MGVKLGSWVELKKGLDFEPWVNLAEVWKC